MIPFNLERPMAQITINEGLAWLKTLKKRHEELLALRAYDQDDAVLGELT
jgi:hypothetical protein